MTERLRSAGGTAAGYGASASAKTEHDLSPRKTLLVLVIVVGCFAVLWPKVFYPMLVGSANEHSKPSPIDKTTGCCDVISEIDVNTIKIMSELCGTIIKTDEDQKPLSGAELVHRCRQEILETCGIDISAALQDQVRLGQNVKQILDEVRSLNGSLCLKYNYGVAPWRLGVPHRVMTVKSPASANIRQERPLHLRSELIHPAFRERGRAIPHPQAAATPRPPSRVIDGRPGPLPGMRPTIGGAGHVVPPPKQGTGSMSVIMPIYTIGIVIFFTYTLMKILFKKQPEGVGGSLYPPIEPDPHFRREVFDSEKSRLGTRHSRDNITSKLGDAELDQLRQRLRETELAMERIVEQMAKVPLKSQDLANGTLSNGDARKPQDEQSTLKVVGMEMSASCEGGQRWPRPDSPLMPSPSPPPAEPVPPPTEIFLEGSLPPESHLLVADSAVEPHPKSEEDPAVVLSGKVTLSVISLDASENGAECQVNKAEPAIEEQKTESPQAISDIPHLEEQVTEDIAEPATVTEAVEEVLTSIQDQYLVEEEINKIEEADSHLEEEVVEHKDQNILTTEAVPEPVEEHLIRAEVKQPQETAVKHDKDDKIALETEASEVVPLPVKEPLLQPEERQPEEISRSPPLEAKEVQEGPTEPAVEQLTQEVIEIEEKNRGAPSKASDEQTKMSDKQDIFTSDTKDASTDKKKKPKSARIVFDDKPMVAVKPVEEKRTLESLSLEELKRQVDAILSEAVDVAAGQLLPEDLIVDSQTGTVCECPATMSGTDTVDDDLLQKNLRDIPSPPEEALEQFNEHVAKSTKSVFGPGSPIDLISVIPKRSQETSSLSSDIPSPPDEALSAFNEHVAKSTSSVFGQGSPIDLIVVIPKQSEESTSLSSDSGLERIEKSTINEESSGNNTETETTGTSMPDTPATGSFASGTLEKSLLSVTEKSLTSPAETSPTVSRVESSSLGTESAVGESDKEEATEDDEGRSNEAEIGSDEDLEEDDEVEVEIEEVEYGSSEAESEEEIEISEPEPEKSDVNVHGNMNGGGDATEESRHATASSETAAENEYSEEEITDDEDEVEDEEEIIEIEEEEEEEEDGEGEIADENKGINHVMDESDPEE